MFCTRCGQHNPPDALYCARCGSPLVRPGEPVAPERPDQTSALNLTTAALHRIEGDHVDESTERDAVAAVDALPPGSALLVVKRGPNAGSRFLLDADLTTAGRHPESDIFLDDVTVSRRHAEFLRSPYTKGFTVRDVGSLNGTYLNRERIDAADLTSGDEVQIGKFRLVFLTGAPYPGGGPL
ncbi:zinc-ribbon and FHA domain-containing protein [Frankia sp. CNm7]|uniref:Zinc-ribbon and FHA domain-containing protein n=1 Tax=Frankia nepalensis TaxID=1836974 RepID=A0A937UTB5_9ACTN|nr:FHA domain-containing protein [Frankia nepalensis]MBL7502799.1 zinc-ribbon and FHA domain-containing protein [Frankia nepalensis]MBL7514579.1 zinc-ribbon and FHA domain-containing protein [Frankia nepalensis]MBL7519407.1 zinc-ribbon and FHA domain-containing protein [Frankia nepalensis]MBL7629836.1 zinc-ribbon and FHA domain-containing protein [Frankia nepalensis]